MLILAYETSCDDTCAAVIKNGREVLSNEIISSAAVQNIYGGVVPEIASRSHVDVIDVVTQKALRNAGLTFNDIDAIAVTQGSGLLGALIVGVSYAKAAAYSLNIPLIPVSHIKSHIAACYIGTDLQPPFICLLASGGHTSIMLCEDYLSYKVLGGTLDDAAGEAFDKVARVLNLGYPGGPAIEKCAKEGKDNIVFPKMLKGAEGYNFSYSGLKTAVLNYINNARQKSRPVGFSAIPREGNCHAPRLTPHEAAPSAAPPPLERGINDICRSFQTNALSVLCEKAVNACLEHNIKTLAAGGGVTANGFLRDLLTKTAALHDIKLYLPPKNLCTDNAAMTGAEGYIQYVYGKNIADLTLNAKANV